MVNISLGSLFRVSSGDSIAIAKLSSHGTYPVYGGNGISGYTSNFNVPPDTLVIGRVGEKCGNVTITMKQSWISDNALIVKKTGECDNKYLMYLLEKIDLNSYANKNAQPVISGNIIYGINTPYHEDLKEQKAISKTITAFDAHIENLFALIEKKRAVRDGALEDLISGRTRLEGFSGDWETNQMGTLGYLYSGLSGKTKEDFDCGGAQYITFLNVLNNTIIDSNNLGSVRVSAQEKQNHVEVGDLFFNASSETPEEVGMCATLLENVGDCFLNSFCFGFRLETTEIDSLYLSYYFNSNIGRAFMRVHAQGSTRYNLSKKGFLQSEICIPKHDEQIAIASVLSAMDGEITALEAERDKITQIREGVMDDLLTGRVRLNA